MFALLVLDTYSMYLVVNMGCSLVSALQSSRMHDSLGDLPQPWDLTTSHAKYITAKGTILHNTNHNPGTSFL